MKIFLDANILVAVLNKEYPVYSYAARILSLADTKRFKIFTSPLCLGIAFYFAEKKSGTKKAKEKISILSRHIEITTMNKDTVMNAILDKKVTDFEDGLEYYAALSAGCKVIVTEDTSDYHFADVEVLTALSFFEGYMASSAK